MHQVTLTYLRFTALLDLLHWMRSDSSDTIYFLTLFNNHFAPLNVYTQGLQPFQQLGLWGLRWVPHVQCDKFEAAHIQSSTEPVNIEVSFTWCGNGLWFLSCAARVRRVWPELHPECTCTIPPQFCQWLWHTSHTPWWGQIHEVTIKWTPKKNYPTVVCWTNTQCGRGNGQHW